MHESMAYEKAMYDQGLGSPASYAQMCQQYRAAHGLTDGLRLEKDAFSEYLARRRAEDQQRRGW